MLKKLGIIVGVLVLLLVVAIVAMVIYIDVLARKGIEVGATQTLGVNTTVGGVNIGIMSGQAGLQELEIANPTGFQGPHFMKLGQGNVAVSLGSLTQPVVEIPSLQLTGIDLYLEKKSGKANYQAILDNLKTSDKQQKAPTTTTPGKEGKKFVVRDLIIRDVTVRADVLPIGGPVTVKVPEIHLQNVGQDGSGVTMGQLTQIITQATLASVFEAGKGILPEDVLGELGKGLEGLSSLASSGVKVVGDLGGKIGQMGQGAVQAVGDVAKGAGDAVKGATKDVTKGVEDLGKGIGNLFGGSSEEKK